MMIPSQISYSASQGAYYIPGQVRLGLEPDDLVPHPPPFLLGLLDPFLLRGRDFRSLSRFGLPYFII